MGVFVGLATLDAPPDDDDDDADGLAEQDGEDATWETADADWEWGRDGDGDLPIPCPFQRLDLVRILSSEQLESDEEFRCRRLMLRYWSPAAEELEAGDAEQEEALLLRLRVVAEGDKRRIARVRKIVAQKGMWGVSVELAERDLSREGSDQEMMVRLQEALREEDSTVDEEALARAEATHHLMGRTSLLDKQRAKEQAMGLASGEGGASAQDQRAEADALAARQHRNGGKSDGVRSSCKGCECRCCEESSACGGIS